MQNLITLCTQRQTDGQNYNKGSRDFTFSECREGGERSESFASYIKSKHLVNLILTRVSS